MTFTIHREGHRFIAIFAAVTLVLFLIHGALGFVGVVLTAWCCYFFRDPDRMTPVAPGLVVSPADGVVQMITRAVPPAELEMGADARPRISIFMNVFDVHVNRAPVDGEIIRTAYRAGKFLNAALDKASDDNERLAWRLRTEDGKDFAMVQIAGLVARRIVSFVGEGHKAKTGERIGMIRFGSRVDVYLPDGTEALVCLGQRCLAGETVLADTTSGAGPRQGETR